MGHGLGPLGAVVCEDEEESLGRRDGGENDVREDDAVLGVETGRCLLPHRAAVDRIILQEQWRCAQQRGRALLRDVVADLRALLSLGRSLRVELGLLGRRGSLGRRVLLLSLRLVLGLGRGLLLVAPERGAPPPAAPSCMRRPRVPGARKRANRSAPARHALPWTAAEGRSADAAIDLSALGPLLATLFAMACICS